MGTRETLHAVTRPPMWIIGAIGTFLGAEYAGAPLVLALGSGMLAGTVIGIAHASTYPPREIPKITSSGHFVVS